jgi:phosphate transport system substrate-binding protein
MEKVIGAINEQFMNDNSGVTVTYDPTGSGTGIKAVTDGTCDIGLSSRALKDEEKASGLESTTIALDGIAIIVNSKSGVTNLTMDQLSQIYTGAITNWSQVGGTDGQIVCIGREAGSGTRDGFESITNTKDKCVLSQELTSTGAVISAVSSNPNAIGYASLADVDTSVKTLSIDGVTPSAATVKDGTYKIQRPFVLVTKKGAKLSDAAQALFDFATSTAANDLISKAGAVPVNK